MRVGGGGGGGFPPLVFRLYGCQRWAALIQRHWQLQCGRTGESWTLKGVRDSHLGKAKGKAGRNSFQGSGRPCVGFGIRRLLGSGGIAVFPDALSSGA